MDLQLESAKRRWKTTGNKIPVLTCLLRTGQEKIIDQLIALWDEDAVFVKYGLSLRTLEENSDHIEGICGCISCITPEQVIKKLREVDLFGQFKNCLHEQYAFDNETSYFSREPYLISMVLEDPGLLHQTISAVKHNLLQTL